MTPAELKYLRYAYALGSSRNLAAHLGCARCTIDRAMKRDTITDYVQNLIDTHPTAARFCDGIEWGKFDSRQRRES